MGIWAAITFTPRRQDTGLNLALDMKGGYTRLREYEIRQKKRAAKKTGVEPAIWMMVTINLKKS